MVGHVGGSGFLFHSSVLTEEFKGFRIVGMSIQIERQLLVHELQGLKLRQRRHGHAGGGSFDVERQIQTRVKRTVVERVAL